MQIEKVIGLGLMSGSSLDGLDLALCEFSWNTDEHRLEDWQLLEAQTVPFSSFWKSKFPHIRTVSAEELVLLDAAFGKYCGEKINAFLQNAANRPTFIASHGHTVFHFPEKGVSLQIGNGAHIAAQTIIPTITSFRDADVAYGGQGAPLAPKADQLLFSDFDFFLNLGGIANISHFKGDHILAYDICGANQILNALSNLLGKPYDEGGEIAASGKLLPDLLYEVNEIDYFRKEPPKSLDNEWVAINHTQPFLDAKGSVEDRLHTACINIGQLIAKAILDAQLDQSAIKVLVTGGGAYNHFLLECIQSNWKGKAELILHIPDQEIIEFKEAALMALLGLLRINNIPNTLSTVTGAPKDTIGGALYLP
ncbi:MAG: anhydro-N-acetylmuramic acid kinase [Bacteroidota bacterium]